MVSCTPVGNRRKRLVPNPPQVTTCPTSDTYSTVVRLGEFGIIYCSPVKVFFRHLVPAAIRASDFDSGFVLVER